MPFSSSAPPARAPSPRVASRRNAHHRGCAHLSFSIVLLKSGTSRACTSAQHSPHQVANELFSAHRIYDADSLPSSWRRILPPERPFFTNILHLPSTLPLVEQNNTPLLMRAASSSSPSSHLIDHTPEGGAKPYQQCPTTEGAGE